ncbi:MAG: AAA family ATPase, partial [Deltaproteobacteria bacterium]|nr:AAA family ATPase [Deltaproteobacteria bacterium]
QNKSIDFDIKPEELIAYLDQYIIKQDNAKAVLSTKICTHFNRIKQAQADSDYHPDMVGGIKNNILMIGPTGVGKTYMIKLIANKIGVPFVKGDATKFSETGYVGGDVDDLVRDLVRDADNDIGLAQCGIIYIDEIDKIASSRNLIGADVSRTGVQRALLKPMEETDIDLKVPHDPISMIQEIERFRKTGRREKNTVNTRNILFIMSGAFNDLGPIIKKRITHQRIGFGASFANSKASYNLLQHIKTEDLIQFGFESEFIGRLPVTAIFEHLSQEDLFQILKTPNNPIILGKKLDFAAYGIDIKFDAKALRILAKNAFEENTGARGLVSAIEKALLDFEKKLPSTNVKKFPVTPAVIEDAGKTLAAMIGALPGSETGIYEKLCLSEKKYIKQYIESNRKNLSARYNLTLTPSRINSVAALYCNRIMDIGSAIKKIKSFYDEIKTIELNFLKNFDINIVLEEDAIDFLIKQVINTETVLDRLYARLESDFKLGLNLIREKTGRNRFFITQKALSDPESFISALIKNELKSLTPA